jgi:glucose/arabinose dehydrogenase
MTLSLRSGAWAAAAVVLVAARLLAQQPPAPAAPPAAGTSQLVDVQGGKVRLVTVATGLFHPWSIAILPDGGGMLVAEKNGHLRMIRNDTLDPQPVWTAPPVKQGDGLHWITLHPQFTQNRLVYMSYPKEGERGNS